MGYICTISPRKLDMFRANLNVYVKHIMVDLETATSYCVRAGTQNVMYIVNTG